MSDKTQGTLTLGGVDYEVEVEHLSENVTVYRDVPDGFADAVGTVEYQGSQEDWEKFLAGLCTWDELLAIRERRRWREREERRREEAP